ncbi:MAG: tetratricopeptide repeat protein, partial [Candidatus Aminicenantaceae bacterium]
KQPAPLAPPGKPSVAIMYFKNITQDEKLDYWRSGLSELLIADLSQSKYINVLSGDRLYKILDDLNKLDAQSYSSDDLEKVVAKGRINHLLQGSYIKVGDTFRINVMLQKAGTGEIIASDEVEGIGDESIFTMVDELTTKIKAHFELTEEEIAGDIDRLAGEITTSSPEAYKYFIEGIKHSYRAENRQALEFYEKAVAVDPEFASAYRSMSMTCYNLRLYAASGKYIKKAFDLIDTGRVSERERLLIQGNYYLSSEKTYDKSIEAFNRLLELYPESEDSDIRSVRNILGMIYRAFEEWDKSIEQLNWLIQRKYEWYTAYVNITEPYMAKGLYDKAKEAIETYHKNFKELPITRWNLALIYLGQGKYNLALAEADKSLSLDPAYYRNFLTKGDVYLCSGDLTAAEKEYKKLLAVDDQAAHFYCKERMGALHLLRGQFEKAIEQLKQGIELTESRLIKSWANKKLAYTFLKAGNHKQALKECNELLNMGVRLGRSSFQINALFIKGLILLEENSVDEAQKAADQIKSLVEEGFQKKYARFYLLLMGKIELKENNLAESTKYFNEALSLEPHQHDWEGDNDHSLFIDSMASVYYLSGEKEKAIQEYERITELTTGRIYYGDIYAKSFYMLGKIYEDKGWKGKAIESYEKFLDLWKDADPGISEVEDAKKRLAALKAQ